MGAEIFFERYKICRDQQGNAEEAGRAGAAVTYKAVDEKLNEPVVLQLIPLAGIDQTRNDEFETRAKKLCELDHVNVARVLDAGIEHDHFVFVTEYLAGETADAWVVGHGTMAIDAVLRIGIQVVRATAAAAFHGLTHRAIQPSNIIILNGEGPCGGWPFVKVLNFGVAALGLHSPSQEARELAPAIAWQFASPEQVSNQQIDFRSEIYSLGATMCFLLTGAVPLPGKEDGRATFRGRRVPDLRSIPKPVGSLLGAMLAENPEHRPLDPVGLERHMLTILDELERRHAFARKVGIPVAAYVQRKIVRSRSPIAQIVRGGLAVAGLLMALVAIGAIVRPNYFHRARSLDKIGVSVGVPATDSANVASPGPSSIPPNILSTARSTASPSVPLTASAAAAPQPSTTPSTSIAQENKRPDNAASTARETAGSAAGKGVTRSGPALAENDASASHGRDRQPASALERPDNNEASPVSRPEDLGKKQSKMATPPRANSLPMTRAQRLALARTRWPRAHFIGMTPRGNMLFRLPSGKIVAVMSGDQQPPMFRPRSTEPEIYGGPRPYGYPPPDSD